MMKCNFPLHSGNYKIFRYRMHSMVIILKIYHKVYTFNWPGLNVPKKRFLHDIKYQNCRISLMINSHLRYAVFSSTEFPLPHYSLMFFIFVMKQLLILHHGR